MSDHTQWQIRRYVEVIADPLGLIEDVVDAFDGRSTATGWMQRLRHGGRAVGPVTVSVDGVHRYLGRECCYDFLIAFDAKPEIPPDTELECPRCRRRFRVKIGPAPRAEVPWMTTRS